MKAGAKVACATSAACAAAKAGKKAAGKAAGAAKKKVEEAAADVADDAFVKFVQRLADGTQTALEKVSTFWLKIPSPDLASGGSGKSWTSQKAVSSLQGNLMPVAAAFAVISFAFALARIAFSPERASEGMRAIGRQLLAVSLATLPALAMTALLIEAGDQFSPWIVKQGSAGGASDGLAKLMEVAIKTGNAGVFLIVFIISLLGSITQVAFMYLRGAAIIVMFVLLPMVAAGSGTEEGWIRLKRMMMLILGFVLYKPVAAIIYATGLKLIGEDTSGDEVQNAIYGMTVICMAALALPAFIKFVMPAAAAGSSSAFSGGAAVGAVAGGAAVVALAAPSGGTSLAAAGGASAVGGAGKAGSETVARGAGGGSGSGGGGGDAGGPPGGGGGGGAPAQPSSGAAPAQSSAPPASPTPAPAPGASESGGVRGGVQVLSQSAADGAKTVRTAGDDAAEGAER